MTTPQPFSDRTTALDFIVSCQQDPATGTAFLGEDRAGVEAELEGLGQPWLQTVRAVVERGRLLAAVAVEWDEEPSMAWVHGPWGTPDAVRTHGPGLVMAAVDQVPPAIRRFELCGHVANTAMAVVADRLGLAPTETSLALVVAADEAAGWIPPEPLQAVTVRPAVPADRAALARLHAPEFGEAYATVDQLLTHHRTVVAEAPDGRLLGYASGRIQDDGSAYVDFTAVDPSARRRGVGRHVVTALVRLLLAEGSPELVHLTVRESRTAAQQLYLSLGMRQDAALRGYRGPRPARDATSSRGAVS
ncbi:MULTISPECIES: GNAT family N-acetyltransferase [Micrococcaceae]|uniref:GNAT family N-acetyltransferase n=1 Tax=Micrococcaceae TaxID=1268 RepID=UPI0016163949|nr:MULTISPECIES: GNAT family N-acetyltransferase [Micrococcaceae]MBB5748351.1 ribosomal protein S18 acetylase RimI-like enzyme [Micrococcus sp. TA1]HRO29507.1 GNAT family N-acetyltransferase [Citricoccus sp.]HRO93538.1 GNAT family N-acetyltransferase [Citricoccus sp.]